MLSSKEMGVARSEEAMHSDLTVPDALHHPACTECCLSTAVHSICMTCACRSVSKVGRSTTATVLRQSQAS